MKLDLQLGSLKFSLGGTKSLSPDLSAWARDEDVPSEGEGARMITPYAQSTWIYIAITRLAEKVSQIPFRISRVDARHAKKIRHLRRSNDRRHRMAIRSALGEDILDSGDVVDLFEQPHPTMNRHLFWEMCVTWLAMRGEIFILPLDGDDAPVDLSERKPRVERLITLPTELFWHIVIGYSLEGWRYTGSPLLTPIPSEMLSPTQVVHARVPNPYLYWRGMSPLLVAWCAASADYAAATYGKGYWMNNADTGVIVTTEQQASPEQQSAILAALRERKRKAGTPDRPLFLWGGATVTKPQLNGMETQFIETRKLNRQEIAAIYKVPDSVMGFSESHKSDLGGGGSQIEQDGINFIENGISPICAMLEAALQNVVMTFGDDLVGWFDIESLPIMQTARQNRLDAAGKAFAIGAAFNDINQVYDLGFPSYLWGAKSFLPFNLQEVTALLENNLPAEDEPPASEGDGPSATDLPEKMARFLKRLVGTDSTPSLKSPSTALLWQSHVKTRRRSVKLLAAKVAKVFTLYRAKTLAKLDEIHLQKGAQPQTSNQKPETRSLVDLVFDPHGLGDALNAELQNPLKGVLDLASAELLAEVGRKDDPWRMPPAEVLAYLARRQMPIQGVGGTARDQLNTSLEQGIKLGETHDQLADRVRAVFTNLSRYEADRVARTEVNGAYNASRHLTMSEAGVEYKAWLSSHGPHVREAHAEAEDTYTVDEPIPVADPFIVGGEELMYPGDDSLGASPGNIINCQCIQLAAQKPETSTDGKSIAYSIHGIGRLTFPQPQT